MTGKEIGIAHILEFRPAGRAVGRRLLIEAGPPSGSSDRDGTAGQTAKGRDGTGACEHLRRLRIEFEPPDEQFPWGVYLESENVQPRLTKCRLVSEHVRGPLRAMNSAATTISGASAARRTEKRTEAIVVRRCRLHLFWPGTGFGVKRVMKGEIPGKGK